MQKYVHDLGACDSLRVTGPGHSDREQIDFFFHSRWRQVEHYAQPRRVATEAQQHTERSGRIASEECFNVVLVIYKGVAVGSPNDGPASPAFP